MQSVQVKKNSKPFRKMDIAYVLYLGFLCMMFLARDVFDISIPLLFFIGYFTIGYIVFDYDHSLAITAMMPLLGHGIQTNYMVLIAIVFYIIKFGGKMSIKTPLFIVGFLMVYELIHVIVAKDSFPEYLRYVIQYAYIGLILGDGQIINLLKKPLIVLKTFIFMAIYFMVDVLLVTLKYVPMTEMMSTGFRFGSLTDFIGTKPSLGDNQNMVALFAIVAISLALVCMFHERKYYVAYAGIVIYFLVFGLLTGSKTFLVCVLLLAALVVLFLVRKSVLKASIFLFIMGVVLIFILKYTPFIDILNNVLERFNAHDISTGRNSLFQLYTEFIFSHARNFLFGIGLQNVEVKSFMSRVPHNAIQEIFVCWGIVGFMAICLLSWQFFKQYRRINKKGKLIYIIPFIIFMIFIQTIQFVRLSAIFGLLVVFYIALLSGNVNEKTGR